VGGWLTRNHPPTFRHDDLSRFKATAPIPVVLKRKGGEEIEGERPTKQAKVKQLLAAAILSPKKSAKTKVKAKANSGSKAPSKPVGSRRLRSGTVAYFILLKLQSQN
jgi:hypothetical protein